MQIPKELHPFSVPTMLVVTDNVHAKLFLASDREIDLVSEVSTKADNMEHERDAVKLGTGAMSSAEPEDDRQDWSREQLYKLLNKDLLARLQKGEYKQLAFTVPHENVNELKESLHIDLLKAAVAFVPKNLAGDDLVDIVAHVQQEL